MKITYMMTQDLESPAGVGRVFPLAREMVSLGHDVTILALHANFKELVERKFTRDGVKVIYTGQMHVLKKDNQKYYFSPPQLATVVFRGTLSLSQKAWQTPADIIHVIKPHPMNSLAGFIGRIRHRCKFVLDCDDLEVENNHFTSVWQRSILSIFERMVPKAADLVSTHNSFLETYLLEWGVPKNKIIYLPNGVDEKRFKAVDQQTISQIREKLGLEGVKVVGFVGSLSTPSHPVDLLIDAFIQIHAQHPAIKLLIVGGGEEYPRLVKRAEKLGLQDSIIFTGRIAGDQVPAYYAVADVIVDPVEDNLVGKTRLPLKLFESWASNTPFITSDVGDRARVLGSPPAGILVPSDNPSELAEAIMKVIQNSNLSQALVILGHKQAQKYTWKKIARDVEKQYLLLLSNTV